MFSSSNKKDDDLENPPGPTDLSGASYTRMSKSSESSMEQLSPGISGLRKRFGMEKQKTQKFQVECTLFSAERSLFSGMGVSKKVSRSSDPNRSSISKMESSLGRYFRGTHSGEYNREESSSSGTEGTTLFIKNMIDKEFPKKHQVPTASQLINVGEIQYNTSLYEPGDWVEIEGLDMKWRLDMITRVIKTAPDDWDWTDPENEGKEPKWTFTYNAGAERNAEAYDLRASETGLKTLFGTRPWVWQQYAMLKLESKLRFQQG